MTNHMLGQWILMVANYKKNKTMGIHTKCKIIQGA